MTGEAAPANGIRDSLPLVGTALVTPGSPSGTEAGEGWSRAGLPQSLCESPETAGFTSGRRAAPGVPPRATERDKVLRVGYLPNEAITSQVFTTLKTE